MKRHFFTLLLASLILGASCVPAQALDIVVHPGGSVSFLPSGNMGQVLGENDEVRTNTEFTEEQKRELRRKSEAAVKEALQKQRENAQPIRPTLTNKNTEIRVKTEGDQARAFLEQKIASRSGQSKPPRSEEIKSGTNVRLQLPQDLKLPESEKRREKSEATAGSEARRERSERRDEILELKSDVNEEGRAELELESREIRAKILNSDVVVDPATNDVALASAPGQLKRRLNHLPDQAIERIQELIELRTQDGETPELELETKEDGSVVYTANTVKRKKLFGLFNRDVETKVELNDETGEVTETEVEPVSAWQRFLNRFAR